MSTQAEIFAAISAALMPAIPAFWPVDRFLSRLFMLMSSILASADRIESMYAIMTVTGADHTGIIAAVTTALAEQEVNILDVSQTIMDNYFTMILRVEFDEQTHDISALQERMGEVEKAQGLVIRIQSEALFTAVNEI